LPCSAVEALRSSLEADEFDAVSNMVMLDNIYTAAGLPLRLPTGHFKEAGVVGVEERGQLERS
jgi:hypothetical protein